MNGAFSDPTYGRRNRIAAVVLVALGLLAAGAAWLFFGVLLALLMAFTSYASYLYWVWSTSRVITTLERETAKLHQRERPPA